MNKIDAALIETVNLKRRKTLPSDYVGRSKYAKKFQGELIRPDGTYYDRNERRSYYAKEERDHPAKTPLHIARWAIQRYTEPNDWVLDPTIGAGTTAVEALVTGRNVFGMEIEFIDVIEANLRINNPHKKKYKIVHGDARDIKRHISRRTFALVVNNPPYSGDRRQKAFSTKEADGHWDTHEHYYDGEYENLAFLNENDEYWNAMRIIYQSCIDRLRPGGRFVIGVKDMMRKKKPVLLHESFGDLLSTMLEYERMIVLKHHPGTLHLHTYHKKYGVHPPYYQTILVFRKKGGRR